MTGMALLAFKGGLISEFFSLLLKSPKKCAKNYDAGAGGARHQIFADPTTLLLAPPNFFTFRYPFNF